MEAVHAFSGTCSDQILSDSERGDQKFVFLGTPISGRHHQSRMQKRLSARTSGPLESSRSGGGSDSELSHVRTDEPRRGKSSRSENFRLWATALQLGSPSGRVNFFNAICRLLMYEGSFLRRFSDLLISTDSLVCAESVSAGVGLRPASAVSIDPPQFISLMVLSIAIILNSRQVSCTNARLESVSVRRYGLRLSTTY